MMKVILYWMIFGYGFNPKKSCIKVSNQELIKVNYKLVPKYTTDKNTLS